MTTHHAENLRAAAPPEAAAAAHTSTDDTVAHAHVPQRRKARAPVADELHRSVHDEHHPSGDGTPAPRYAPVARGVTSRMSTLVLRERIHERVLLLGNRFRVIRSIDVAASCFPERPFKAALTAAQRALRGMTKARLLARYRTDRQQTVYAITARGAAWLNDAGHDGAPSVRRVSDMSNPEHRLWLQFAVIACEARGLVAFSESETLARIASQTDAGKKQAQGMLEVAYTYRGRTVRQQLRPDALALEADSATWFEIDASKRGAARETALAALVMSIGGRLAFGPRLRRVVVLTKTERIRKRAHAVLNDLVHSTKGQVLIDTRRQVKKVDDNVYEIWGAVEKRYPDGRTAFIDARLGYVIVQPLPVWLPKLRVQAGGERIPGWFDDASLPYTRPTALTPWSPCSSPLLDVES